MDARRPRRHHAEGECGPGAARGAPRGPGGRTGRGARLPGRRDPPGAPSPRRASPPPLPLRTALLPGASSTLRAGSHGAGTALGRGSATRVWGAWSSLWPPETPRRGSPGATGGPGTWPGQGALAAVASRQVRGLRAPPAAAGLSVGRRKEKIAAADRDRQAGRSMLRADPQCGSTLPVWVGRPRLHGCQP